MKFGILIQRYFPYGGLQRDSVRLAQAAKLEGDSPILIVSIWEGPKPEGIEIHELHAGGVSNHEKARLFAEAARDFCVNYELETYICFSRVDGSPFHFCGDPCYKHRIGKRKLSFVKWLPRYKYLLNCEEGIFGGEATTHIFFLAASEIKAYEQIYPLTESRFTLLPPWLKQPKKFAVSRESIKRSIYEELGMSIDSRILLFVGSDFERKGLDLAIEALAILDLKDTHLVACGQYSATKYTALADSLGLSDRVHILGARDDIPEMMTSADLLIHPARQETAGMVLVEALTYNLPVLCTENCGYSHVVKEAGCDLIPQGASAEVVANLIQGSLSKLESQKESISGWLDKEDHFRTASIILDEMRSSLV